MCLMLLLIRASFDKAADALFSIYKDASAVAAIFD